jgi:tetratricopeptide (TPR) repeat protein
MELEPRQVESLYYLGVIAGQQGSNEKSIDLLKTVIARSPRHPRAHIALGMEYRTADQLPEAKRELETAVQITPDSQKAHYQLGLVLMKLHEPREGRAELAMVQRLKDPSDEKVDWQLASPPDRAGATTAGKGK